MPASSRFEPADSFVDPRTLPGFQASHWPLCDGEAGPAIAASDRHSRRCIEFLAAYYAVNCRHAELLDAREGEAGEQEIKARLDAVAEALATVDAIEDRYAPVGFYGEPTMNGFFYQDISFMRPEVPRTLQEPSMQSSHLAVPGLEDIPESELFGPVVITRGAYGKVDI